jgi:hypothetical protein
MRQFVSLGPTGGHATEGALPIVDVRESATEITIAYRFPGFYRAEHERLLDGKPVMFQQVDMDAVGELELEVARFETRLAGLPVTGSSPRPEGGRDAGRSAGSTGPAPRAGGRCARC